MGPAREDHRLTSYEATLTTAECARVVPGQPQASELLRRLRGQARPPMPLDGVEVRGRLGESAVVEAEKLRRR